MDCRAACYIPNISSMILPNKSDDNDSYHLYYKNEEVPFDMNKSYDAILFQISYDDWTRCPSIYLLQSDQVQENIKEEVKLYSLPTSEKFPVDSYCQDWGNYDGINQFCGL